MVRKNNNTKTGKSWFFKFVLIEINLTLIYLIIELEQVLLLIGIMGLMILIVGIFNIMKSNSSSKYKEQTKSDLADMIKLSIRYLKMNKKYLIASSFGLVLALLVISQSFIMSSSYQQKSLDDYLEGNDVTGYNFIIKNVNPTEFYQWNEYLESQIDPWLKEYDLDSNNFSTHGMIFGKVLLGDRYNLDIHRRWVDFFDFSTNRMTLPTYNLLKQFPSFPGFTYNESETLLIAPPWLKFPSTAGVENYTTSDFVINNEIRLLVDEDYKITTNLTIPFNNISYSIDRVWQTTIHDFKFKEEHDIVLDSRLLTGSLFVPAYSEWDLYYQLMNATEAFGEQDMVWGGTGLMSKLNIRIPEIREMSLDQLKYRLQQAIDTMRIEATQFISVENGFNSSVNYLTLIVSPLLGLIKDYGNDLQILKYIIIISSFPIILISLYLLYFSLTLIETRKLAIFIILKSRGSSINQLRTVAFVEVIITSIIATIIGMLSSIPMVMILLRSSGILEFNLPPILLSIPFDWYYRMPILGILLAIDFNAISILQIESITVEENFSGTPTKSPLWQKINLDLFLFSIGIIYWLILFTVPVISEENNLLMYGIIGPILLGFVILGFPLVIGRYFIEALGRLLKVTKFKFELIALAITNLQKRKNFTSQLVALSLTSMMLVIVSLMIPASMDTWGHTQSNYNNGADIYVQNIDPTQVDLWGKLSVDGVEAITEVTTMNYNPFTYEVQTGAIAYRYKFIGINQSTFSGAAYWDDNQLQGSLSEIIHSIASTNISVGIQEDVMEAMELSVGDTFALKYGAFGREQIDLEIVSSFKYFPNLVDSLPTSTSEGVIEFESIPILTNYRLVEYIAEVTDRSIEKGAYLKVAVGSEIHSIIDQLESLYYRDPDVFIFSYAIDSKLFGENQQGFLLSSMHAMLLITLIVNIAAISYYSFITLHERRNELGIYKALGMVRKQMIFLLFNEILLIVISSILFGIIAGSFISYSTFQIMINVGLIKTILPFKLSLPIKEILIFSSLSLALSSLSAIYPAIKIARSQTGNVLRAEP